MNRKKAEIILIVLYTLLQFILFTSIILYRLILVISGEFSLLLLISRSFSDGSFSLLFIRSHYISDDG